MPKPLTNFDIKAELWERAHTLRELQAIARHHRILIGKNKTDASLYISVGRRPRQPTVRRHYDWGSWYDLVVSADEAIVDGDTDARVDRVCFRVRLDYPFNGKCMAPASTVIAEEEEV